MTKTSKVKTIQGEPKFWEQNQVYYHNVEMENGDKLNIGKKRKLNIGDELTYEITGDDQHEYRKAKSAVAPPPSQGGYSKKSGNNASFALSYAKDTIVGLGAYDNLNEIGVETTRLADHFLKWLNKNS